MGEAVSEAPSTKKVQHVHSYPYPVVEGIPSFETDSKLLGQKPLSKKRMEALERKANKQPDVSPKRKTMGSTLVNGQWTKPALKNMMDSIGNVVKRPPLSRTTSVGDLGDIQFVGINHKEPEDRVLANIKRGLRLSMCWDNVSSYGSNSWHTTNGEFGAVKQPSVLKLKRNAVKSFENSRFLAHHPHWQDRPAGYEVQKGRTIWTNEPDTPPSTYMDLGNWYQNNNGALPEGYAYMPRRKQPDQGIPFGPNSIGREGEHMGPKK